MANKGKYITGNVPEMSADVCPVVAYLTLAHTTIPLKKVDDVRIRKLAYKNKKSGSPGPGLESGKPSLNPSEVRIRNNTNHFELFSDSFPK
jgi:hypothetical protein